MIPIVGVPQSTAETLQVYRPAFARQAGFDHVSRYITGLLTSPNKTLQAIYGLQSTPNRIDGLAIELQAPRIK